MQHNEFDEVYDLMVTSFPSSERRSYEDQKALLENIIMKSKQTEMIMESCFLLWQFGN